METANIKSEIARIHNSLKSSVAPFTSEESDKVTEASYPEDYTQYYPNPDAPHAHTATTNAIRDLARLYKKLGETNNV